jgi:hypothetical protein
MSNKIFDETTMRIALLALPGFIAFSSLACAAAGADAIIIVDATAQMNAKLGQSRKIDLVRKYVGAAAGKVDPDTRVALWAFGASPANKCEDAQALVSLRAARDGASSFDKALQSLQPKAARSPILYTLRAALTADGDLASSPASALIIAGTGDDCTADICAEAEKLRTSYPKVRLTVLGLGMSDGSAAKFTCAAKALGGAFIPVKSASELEKSISQALDVPQGPGHAPLTVPPKAGKTALAAETAPAPESAATVEAPVEPGQKTPAEKAPQAKAPPAAAPQSEPNATLSAVMTSGADPLEGGVSWSVYKVSTTPTGQTRVSDAPVWAGGGGLARIRLADGHYIAKATYGYASGSGEFTLVKGEKTEAIIVLEAGGITVDTLQAEDGAPADETLVAIFRGRSANEELGRSTERPALFYVNAGDYKIRATSGLARSEKTIRVEPGKVSAVRVALDVGVFEVKTAVSPATMATASLWHRLYRKDAGPGQGPILNIQGPSSRVELPAGEYRLQTLYGAAQIETAVTVVAGRLTSQTVALTLGEAKVVVPQGKGRQECDAFEADKDRRAGPLARAAGQEMSFILDPGRYDIVCHTLGAPAETSQAEISLAAGETQSVKINQ